MPKSAVLITIFLALVLSLLTFFVIDGSSWAKPVLSESELVGAWVAELGESSGEGDTHEMNFEVIGGKNIFNSYLHRRPEFVDCVWNLRRSTVEITCDTLTDTFEIESLTSTTLVIDREGKMITYRRFGD